jgi:hypothetical protein
MYTLQYHHDDFINKISGCLHVGLMAREFDELALLVLDGHNYPTWALDVKISLAFRWIIAALTPSAEGEAAFLHTYKYQTLYIIRNHLHPDLKSEYVMEEEPHSLWVTLKGCYEQQKTILLPEAVTPQPL